MPGASTTAVTLYINRLRGRGSRTSSPPTTNNLQPGSHVFRGWGGQGPGAGALGPHSGGHL